ncbi:MAG: hypothetical protein AAGC55_01615 [Myxococcota bacterium]
MQRRHFWALLASSGLLGGCFYTGAIRDDPDVSIVELTEDPQLNHHRGDQVQFSAEKSSGIDAPFIELQWTARTCEPGGVNCGPAFATRPGADRLQPFSFTIPATHTDDTPTQEVFVLLTARDTASEEELLLDQDTVSFLVINRAPEQPELQIQAEPAPDGAGYPVATTIPLVARSRDSDGDPLELTWSFDDRCPECFVEVAPTFSDANGYYQSVYEFTPNATGMWEVVITASDTLDATERRATIAIQSDAAPCIGTSDPALQPPDSQALYIVERNAGPRRFSVLSVRDDLDVYPPPDNDDPNRGAASFRWLIARPETGGALEEVVGYDLADYEINPSVYAPGDRLTVRVEIEDRQERQFCAETEPLCSQQGNTCYQRATWEIEIR